MHCEQINPQLIDYAEGALDESLAAQVEAHVDGCPDCQTDLAAIAEFRNMAENWHDEVPPAWTLPALDRPSRLERFLDEFRQWFPTAASATALVLVSVMYFQDDGTAGVLPAQQQVADYESLPELPQATQAAFDNALATDRENRKEELSSLLEILTAEMNRRSIETEESLRFLIKSQIQGQQELDQLYQLVDRLQDDPEADGADASSGAVIDPTQQRIYRGVAQ